MPSGLWIGFFGLVVLVAAGALVHRARAEARVRARLFAGRNGGGRSTSRAGAEGGSTNEAASEARSSADPPASLRSALARWLERAGHRGASASRTFVLALVVCGLAALGLVSLLRLSGAAEALAASFAGLPVLGPGLAVFARLAPWGLALGLATAPIWVVRRDRARRVEEIERDLPLVIELLATLAEAGLGFESAIAQVLGGAGGDERPLMAELRLYRLEVSTGGRRGECLARLAERIDLPSVTAFTSALVHAEQTGTSIAGLLRPQAGLVRQRRRERALAAAEALPEKLVVPLLVGFLPGLLVWTLGPAFFQLFSMLDAAMG